MFEATLIEVPTHIPLEDYRSLACRCSTRAGRRVHRLRPGHRRQLPAARRKVVPDRRAGQPAHALRDGPALRRVAGRGLRRLQRARRDEGLAQARRLRRRRLAVRPEAQGSRGPDAGAHRGRAAPAARRLLPRQPQDLVAMHSAMAEVGVLFATATVHEGWTQVDARARSPTRRRCRAATRSPSSPTTARASGSRTRGAPAGARAASRASPTTTGWPTAPTSGSRGSARRCVCG